MIGDVEIKTKFIEDVAFAADIPFETKFINQQILVALANKLKVVLRSSRSTAIV